MTMLMIVFALAFTSCVKPISQAEKMEKFRQDSTMLADSLYNAQLNVQATQMIKTIDSSAAVADTSVKIIKAYTSEPNSAGGVDAHIIWKNISTKTIKYITFECVPFNRVDDVVSCEIRGESIQRLQVVGPIKPGQTYGYGYLWECMWYNSSITHMKVISTEVIFM